MFLVGRFKQLLAEKGRDAERREEKSRHNSAALGQVLFPSQGEAVLQVLEPQPGGEVNCVLPTRTQIPDRLDLGG